MKGSNAESPLVADRLARRGSECEAHLRAAIDAMPHIPARLRESIDYSLFAGGKRLRPALVFEWHAAISGEATPNASALAAAGAIELIHTFSLVHDDLPAMDDDDLRRGQKTNHRQFDEATAILAGDAMTTLAFETIAMSADAKHVAALVRELAYASGPQGMIGGQIIDIASENQSLELAELQQLHAMKTGALLTSACRLGAIAADATHEQLDAATKYGRHLGLAFQIMDDVLDATSTPQQMGKATKKDDGAGKNTYPRLLGIEKSVALAQREIDLAITSLQHVRQRSALDAMARFVIERQR